MRIWDLLWILHRPAFILNRKVDMLQCQIESFMKREREKFLVSLGLRSMPGLMPWLLDPMVALTSTTTDTGTISVVCTKSRDSGVRLQQLWPVSISKMTMARFLPKTRSSAFIRTVPNGRPWSLSENEWTRMTLEQRVDYERT